MNAPSVKHHLNNFMRSFGLDELGFHVACENSGELVWASVSVIGVTDNLVNNIFDELQRQRAGNNIIGFDLLRDGKLVKREVGESYEGKAELLRQAFVDLLDGCRGPHEIRENTGLPDARCQEIYNLFLLARLGLEALPS